MGGHEHHDDGGNHTHHHGGDSSVGIAVSLGYVFFFFVRESCMQWGEK